MQKKAWKPQLEVLETRDVPAATVNLTVDPGATTTRAQSATLSGVRTFAAGMETGADVDLYRIDLSARSSLRVELGDSWNRVVGSGGTGLRGMIRVFDARGNPISSAIHTSTTSRTVALGFSAPVSGSYFIGVSAAGNAMYNVLTGAGAVDPTPAVNPADRGTYTLSMWATPTVAPAPIAWGAKVSEAFRVRVREISTNLGVNVDFLMAAMAFETGESFRPDIRNAAGSGAIGLIQFMPSTAVGLGTTTTALAQMTAVQQLDFVERYFQPYRNRLQTLEDVYMAILWPAAVGRPNDFVLFSRPSTTYTQNAGLDRNQDGKITKAEAASLVQLRLTKGRQTGFIG